MKKQFYNKSTIPRIQVLRGLAVCGVIFFHLGLPIFSGGFLGVDLFFVISGYFMYQIYSKVNTKISSAHFYVRRINRLLPTFLLVFCIVYSISFFRFLPHERLSLFRHSLTDLTFLSNLHFWLGNQYFSSGELRPTLLFWSLAVEIQFYLLFPIIYRLLVRKYRWFIFIMLVSLFLFIVFNILSPQSAFFLLPPRLWQFGVGMFFALLKDKKLVGHTTSPRHSSIYFSLCCLSITILVLVFKILPLTHFGVGNLAVTLMGGFALYHAQSIARLSLLEIVLTKIGNASYSIYLVHLPAIVLINYKPFEGNNSPKSSFEVVSAFLIILTSGFLVYLLFEKPIRTIQPNRFIAISFTTIFILLVPINLNKSEISTGFTDEKVNRISMAIEDRTEFRCGTWDRLSLFRIIPGTSKSCKISQNGRANYLLVGNSHADSIKSALASQLEKAGNSLYILKDNFALSNSNFDLVILEATRLKVAGIVLHSSAGTTNPITVRRLARFAREQGINLVVIGPVPTYSVSVPKAILNGETAGSFAPILLRYKASESKKENELWVAEARAAGYLFIEAELVFCESLCRVSTDDGYPFYFDESHLTLTGAKFLIGRISESLTSKSRD